MKRKSGTRARGIMLLSVLLLAVASVIGVAAAEGEGALKPYDKESGYTYVLFGRYPQSIDGGVPEEGNTAWGWRKQYRDWEEAYRKEHGLKIHDPIDPWDPGPVDPEPILWRVLSADTEQIYLMSEYVLFAAPLHTSMAEYRQTGSDFGTTSMCRKLNGEFADAAFTEGEMEALLPFGEYGKVSLPCGNDLNDPATGITKKKLSTRKAWATEYAIRSTGAFVYQVKTGCHTPYWLREQAESDKRQARSTKQTGSVGRLHCDAADVGARPVILLAPGKFRIAGGSGTREDPYRLEAGE